MSLQKLFQVFDNHFHRTLVLFQNKMVTIFIHPSYFCSQNFCSEIQNLRLAAKFTFSANIICYNDPNFLCWHNLLTEILHFEHHKTLRQQALISDGRELTSLFPPLTFMNCDFKIPPLMDPILTKSFDFTHSFPAFSQELCTPCPIFVLMGLNCALK